MSPCDLIITFISLPISTLRVTHGVRSTIASNATLFYQPLVSVADSTITQSYASTVYKFSIYLCMLSSVLITIAWWFLSACLFIMALSDFWHPSTSTSVVLTFSTRSGFSLFVHKAMLPRTLISIDATLCTASASHVHVPGPLQGPIYLPLGCTLSILVNTNNIGDAHDAWVFILLCTLHCHLPISDLVRGIGRGTSLAMLH